MDTHSVMTLEEYEAYMRSARPDPDAWRIELDTEVDGVPVHIEIEADGETVADRYLVWLNRMAERYGWHGNARKKTVYRVGGHG